MKIVPAIDIIDAKCIRLTEGDYSTKKVYRSDPLEVAKEFEGVGITRLHLVDLDGAKNGAVVHYKILEKIASGTNLTIDFGGGVSSLQILKSLRDAGASMFCIGSAAVKQKQEFFEWLEFFGSESIILSADVKDKFVALDAWQNLTDIKVDQFLTEYTEQGVSKAMCTDIGVDGTLAGPSLQLYKELLESFPQLFLIASGGVAEVKDLEAVQELGVPEVVVGKAIYEGHISLQDLESFNA